MLDGYQQYSFQAATPTGHVITHDVYTKGDRLCTAKKFEQLDKTFSNERERMQLVELPGKGHSVLTRDLLHGGHRLRKLCKMCLTTLQTS
jgi:hypothetical protein